MNLETFVKETFEEKNGYCFRPKIVCNDGFTMSVQGSNGHYCHPRQTMNWYSEMEVGFPSEKEDLIIEYAECADEPTETVYGYVPVHIIQEVIDKHGGINITKTLNK